MIDCRKTSLIRALTGKSGWGYSGPSGDTLSTEGIDVGDWKMSSSITFSLWDFGGQEIFYPTHQFFITGRSVYIILFDLSKPLTESRIEYWVKKISVMTTGKTPIILVGTHADDPSLSDQKIKSIIEGLKLKYGPFRFYFITDGFKLKCLIEEELTYLLIRFVRMSDKKHQQETINEIKQILRIIGPKGFT